MKNHTLVVITVFLALLFSTTTFALTIDNISHDFEPENQRDYVNYLRFLLGLAEENNQISLGLKKILSGEKISILNAQQKISFILTENEGTNNDQAAQNTIQINGQQIKQLVSSLPQLFSVSILPKTDEQKINQILQQQQKIGKIVHIIKGSQSQINILAQKISQQIAQNILNIKTTRKLSETKKSEVSDNQVDPTPTSSYITKFFFIFVFIFITIGSISLITGMQNKKDTLLYAKFIADVGK